MSPGSDSSGRTDLRCFIAIDMPAGIKNELEDLVRTLKKHDADVKWVNTGNIHLTLKFLGKTGAELLPRIRKALAAAVSSYEPFYIRINGTGVFPEGRNPRVIWVGMEDLDILRKLRDDIERSMSLLGYEEENRKFMPHLTLGRVRSRKGVIGLLGELDRFREKDFGMIHVGNIKLMKSELKPKGAEYSCIYELPLGTAR